MTDAQADIVYRIRNRPNGLSMPSDDRLLIEAAETILALRHALVPFANIARTGVVQDALSFGRDGPQLRLARGYGEVLVNPWAFSKALELT